MTVTRPRTQNKSLSDNLDEVLKLQGIPWLQRKAFNTVNLTSGFRQHADPTTGAEVVEIFNSVSAGGPSGEPSNVRILDFQERKEENERLGSVVAKSRRVDVAEMDDVFFRDGWTEDTVECKVIHIIMSGNVGQSDAWTMEQVWGFENKDGERRHTRRIKFTSAKVQETHKLRLYFDYGEWRLSITRTI